MPRRFAVMLWLCLFLPHFILAAEAADDLWAAARKGDAKAVENLLTKGIDVNAKTKYGATALSYAADKGHVEVVKVLLKHKAAVNAKDTFYNATPLTWALYRQHWEVVKLLIEAGADGASSVLASAANQGQVEVVRAILAKSKFSEATLSAALANAPAKEKEIIELLKKAGAKPPAKVAQSPAKPSPATPGKPPATAPDPVPVDEGPLLVTQPANWPAFRNLSASGVADGQHPPLSWDVEKSRNVVWKTPIPGLGHSCPIVWGERVFVTTAISGDPRAGLKVGQYGNVDSVKDETPHTWRVYCLDKRTGKIVWERTACQRVPKVKRHTKGSHANPTPATDGKHLIASFGSEGLYCYDLDGNLLWKRDLGVLDSGWFFDPEYQWGFGSSPILYRNLVIVQCDTGKNSFIAAYNVEDGQPVWQTPRDEIPSWGTPTVIEGPRAELVTNATNFVRGYDPQTGKELWRLSRNAEIAVPTPVGGHGLIFVTSGYRPIQPVYAIRPGASGDITLKKDTDSNAYIAWSKSKGGPYMPTPIVYGDYLYTCANAGLLTCYEAKTGKQVYQQRLGGAGGYTASPVAADGRLYFASEEGDVHVVQAGPKYQLIAVNHMGDLCMATPAISDGMLFVRTQHYVYALGGHTAARVGNGR